ncbi:MAG: hypothetical protein KY467_16245 [Gemmatimonadetes bacterium]|nr:hypothetical protein [Gemmatimonadota bacterium]
MKAWRWIGEVGGVAATSQPERMDSPVENRKVRPARTTAEGRHLLQHGEARVWAAEAAGAAASKLARHDSADNAAADRISRPRPESARPGTLCVAAPRVYLDADCGPRTGRRGYAPAALHPPMHLS